MINCIILTLPPARWARRFDSLAVQPSCKPRSKLLSLHARGANWADEDRYIGMFSAYTSSPYKRDYNGGGGGTNHPYSGLLA